MIVVGWLATSAWAAPCAEVPALVGDAWSAYEDAELDRADALLDQGVASLGCQDAVVPTADLLGLFRLSALVALSRGDRDGAVVHTIRALVVDPSEAPPLQYGPQLQELHQSWKVRLGNTTYRLRVEGGSAYVDGRPIGSGASIALLPGDHLVQWAGEEGFRSEFRELTVDTVLSVATSELAEDMEGAPPPDRVPRPSQPDEPREGRRHRGGLLAVGSVLALAGGGVVGYGFVQEQTFSRDAYDAPQYGSCAVGSRCYDHARIEQIEADAAEINVFYAVGYGVAGLGVLTFGTEMLILPAPTRGGGGIAMRVRW